MTQHNRILVTKDEQEGGFYIIPQGNGDTAMIDRSEELPEWAESESLASADLKEHKEFYAKRVGADQYGELFSNTMGFEDLLWDAVDEEGDIVKIEPDQAWRLENLADKLGLEPFDELEATAEISSKDTAMGEPTLGDVTGTLEDSEKRSSATA